MALLRGLGRAAPLLAAGLAAGWYLRRQGLLGAPPRSELPRPPEPAPAPPRAPQLEPDPEPRIEAHVEAVEAVSDAADVTAVIEDLLAVAPGEEEEIVDSEVVDEGEADLAADVRAALAGIAGPVRVESSGGVIWLRGELERQEAIADAERRAAAVNGVLEVRNLLHLTGTPPPTT